MEGWVRMVGGAKPWGIGTEEGRGAWRLKVGLEKPGKFKGVP